MDLPIDIFSYSVFFHQGDYINFEKIINNNKIRLEFIKIPDFYCIDGKPFFATEIKVEGLKLISATVIPENVLNIRLKEMFDCSPITRNVNFVIPNEAQVLLTTVEIYNGNKIYIRAPFKE